MKRLTEAAERVLAAHTAEVDVRNCKACAATHDDALHALRTALTEARAESDLRDKVVEAARAYRDYHARLKDADTLVTEARAVIAAADALDAATRPRYEAWQANPAVPMWDVGIPTKQTLATFYGPDAEQHAKEWAARMNERGK